MIRHFSQYNKLDGLFTGVTHGLSHDVAAPKDTDTVGYVDGKHDHLAKRFDLDLKIVIEYKPPQPSTDHEWNMESKRWELSAAAATLDAMDAEARTQITALEAKQLRAMRELMIDRDNIDAIQRLDAIDTQIANLRIQLKR